MTRFTDATAKLSSATTAPLPGRIFLVRDGERIVYTTVLLELPSVKREMVIQIPRSKVFEM